MCSTRFTSNSTVRVRQRSTRLKRGKLVVPTKGPHCLPSGAPPILFVDLGRVENENSKIAEPSLTVRPNVPIVTPSLLRRLSAPARILVLGAISDPARPSCWASVSTPPVPSWWVQSPTPPVPRPKVLPGVTWAVLCGTQVATVPKPDTNPKRKRGLPHPRRPRPDL